MDDIQKNLIIRAIQEDAVFVGNYSSSLQHQEQSQFAPFLAFCMGSYMALFVYESQRQIKRIDPEFATELSESAQQVLARSRHSLKLFEDSKLGVEGIQEVFWDKIVPAHRDYFVSLLRFRWLEPLAKDIGVYRYNGKVISTTHAASFSLGLEAQSIASDSLGEDLFSISREYGQYFAQLGAKIDTAAVSFPSFLNAELFTQKEEDYRAREYYRGVFNGPETPALNATLLLLLGHLNFINEIVRADNSANPLQYSTFKIRFLGTYQVVRSLDILRAQQYAKLAPRSIQVIDSILHHPVAVILVSDEMRPLRNTLMHYDVDSRLDHTKIDANNLTASLLAAVLGDQRGGNFIDDFDVFVSKAAQLMNDWM